MPAPHHLERVAGFSVAEVKRGMAEVHGLNAKLAVLITRSVGTMLCAWCFAALALLSLPAAVSTGALIVIVAWIAQTFLQLVLLSIIMVGQRVSSAASDARAEKQFTDTEMILELMNAQTEGGLGDVLAAIDALDHKRHR